MLAVMLLSLLLMSAVRAECLDRYDAVHRRSAITAASGAGAAGLISAGAGLVFFNATVMPHDPRHGNIYVVLLGMTVSGAAVATAGGAATTVKRHLSVAQTRALLVEAQLGDGPALRAFAADLEAETGRSWTVEDVAAELVAMNAEDALCEHGVRGRRAAQRRVIRALEEAPAPPNAGSPPPDPVPDR